MKKIKNQTFIFHNIKLVFLLLSIAEKKLILTYLLFYNLFSFHFLDILLCILIIKNYCFLIFINKFIYNLYIII